MDAPEDKGHSSIITRLLVPQDDSVLAQMPPPNAEPRVRNSPQVPHVAEIGILQVG